MKVRKLVIGVRDTRAWAGDVKRTLRRAASGQRVARRESLYFENAAALRNFFSARGFELRRAIRRHEPQSIKELAERVKRDFKNVYSDVQYLARLGLVELGTERAAGTKGRKTPRVVCDQIELRIRL